MKTDYRNFWFYIFNERHPDEVKDIMDGDKYKEWLNKDRRPVCDECGKPLLDSELNIGTCEDCLCPE